MYESFFGMEHTPFVRDVPPEKNKLKLQRYAAIRQRIDMYCTLPHLDRSETEQYIASHMTYSGCQQEIFTTKALDEVHKASAGIPRMINRVCEKALMYAFQNQKRLIVTAK